MLQRANVSHPPYSGRVVIQAPTGASNALFEDPTALVKDAHFVESVACNNHCPPCSVEPVQCSNTCPACSQFKDFPLVMATLQRSIDLERKKLKKKQPLKLLDATKNRILRMYRNATGSVCRAPSLLDRLPQSFIHRTTDFSSRYLVGHPDDVSFHIAVSSLWIEFQCRLCFYSQGHLPCTMKVTVHSPVNNHKEVIALGIRFLRFGALFRCHLHAHGEFVYASISTWWMFFVRQHNCSQRETVICDHVETF